MLSSCFKYFRLKFLNQINYNGQMGTGLVDETYSEPEKERTYPLPDYILHEFTEKLLIMFVIKKKEF